MPAKKTQPVFEAFTCEVVLDVKPDRIAVTYAGDDPRTPELAQIVLDAISAALD